MRLTLLSCLFLLTVQYALCYNLPRNRRSIYIIDKITNTTSRLTNYVKEKGRSLKNFYKVNVNDRVSSLFGSVSNTVEDKLTRMKNKLKGYIQRAEDTASSIFDIIAPDSKEKCSEEEPVNHMTTPQLISLHGYMSESHTITTEDGYILTLHRIPRSKNNLTTFSNRTVLLQHGLFGSSADWVIAGPSKGLAFILSDSGYDVWMANSRGNTYSRAHTSRKVSTLEFWNFTFHEIGQYDLPASIDYIRSKKDYEKINYVAFSMGTTALFSLLSTKGHYNEILNTAIALAPIAYMNNIKSPIKLLAEFGNEIETFMKLVGSYEFLPRNAVVRYMTNHACKLTQFEEAMCEISMFVLCGYSKQFDWSLNPLIMAHLPAGASTKALVHYAQEIRHGGKFQQFDYGSERNLELYGTAVPPQYPVSNITLPIALISAEDDWLSSVSDATILYEQFRNPIEHYKVPSPDFNHLDFLFSLDAPDLVYVKLLELLKNADKKH